MRKVKGDYWKTEQNTVKIQIRTQHAQEQIQEALPGWVCISFGYVPKTSEDIYVFEKEFKSEIDWTNFLNSDKLKESIEMKEVPNG